MILPILVFLILFAMPSLSDEIKVLVAFVLLLFAAILTFFIRTFVNAYLSPSRERSISVVENDDSALPLLQFQPAERSSSELNFSSIAWSNVLTVFLNGETIQLVNPDPTELLSTFIRDDRGLKGTKLGCEEGGCGACTVVLTRECPSDSSSIANVSVNSCLRPLCANDGMAITTIEGIGSVREGLSEEQSRLVKCNGTQCGFCTPGWVTNMHALNVSSGSEGSYPSKREIDAYFDGNICRCTGYKPIMKAFQSFSHEALPLPSQSSACAGLCASKKNCPKLNQADGMSAGCCSVSDIEEISGCCSANSKEVSVVSVSDKTMKNQQLISAYVPKPLMFYNPLKNVRWVRPVGLKQLCAVLRRFSDERVQLVGGNTSIGVTKYLNKSGPYNRADAYDVFVDINLVPEMVIKSYSAATRTAAVGAAVSINEVIALLQKNSTKTSRTPTGCNSEEVNHHSVFSVTAHHLSKIANTQVRNAGTWAGNLMVFLHYTSFPSDAVIALATANARLQLCSADGEIFTMDMATFLNMDYASFLSQGSIILSMSITEPRLAAGSVLVAETFKVAQRTANAHAHVNCGFQFSISYQRQQEQPDMVYPVCTYARVVIGGVSKKTFIASRTESALTNAFVCASTLGNALAALDIDLAETGESQQFGNQTFRKSVMQTCLYRALLKCYPVLQLPQNLLSAVQPWVKPASRGTEVFVPPSDEKPVGLPVRKLEGPIQATGEAVFPSDEVMTAQGLHGALVFSTRCAVKLSGFDFSAALATPGVVAILTSDDIPAAGKNAIADKYPLFIPIGSDVPCVGATLAVVVASTESVANEAAALVNVIYADTGIVPVISLSQAVDQQSFYAFPPPGVIPGVTLIRTGNADKAMSTAYKTVTGQASAGGQYHFYMETQTAVASIVDGDVINVTCGTQFPSNSQNSIASLLGVQQNKVQVKCPRAGGAFGGKITRGMAVSGAAALCAYKLGKPVRIFNTRTADMNMQSGREAWQMNYQVGFSKDGLVTALKYDFYVDAGCANDDVIGNLYMGMNWADNAYYFPNYRATGTVCYTNTPPRTYVRAPGVVQSCLFTEMVIARVATELNLPLETVQSRNFIKNGETTILGQPIKDCTLPTVWSTLLERSRYQERLSLCQKYNQTSSSLWRKKGIAICPVKYGMGWSGGFNAGVKIGIIASDGTVCVNHSGAEIGQGMNTKVAQAVAYGLGVPIDIIRITCNTTDSISNAGCTGGSGGSEVTVQAALNACTEMNARLEPYKKEGKSWADMIASIPCDVSLNAEGWFSPVENPNGQPFQYFVYAACVTEVELDVLSGNMHILASEIVYDCGKSLNPAVDIGQIEGGLIMGLGYFLTEKMEYGEDGTLLSTGTWEYKPPTAQDVPSVLNVTLLRNVNNPDGILGSKAVGEPPNIVANSFYFALRMAVGAARADAGVTGHFNLDVPATVDLRQQSCLVNPSRFVMPY